MNTYIRCHACSNHKSSSKMAHITYLEGNIPKPERLNETRFSRCVITETKSCEQNSHARQRGQISKSAHFPILVPTSCRSPSTATSATPLLDSVNYSGAFLIVTVVLLFPPLNSATSTLAEWGTAARVLRIAKPPTRSSNQSYLISLHGLARINPFSSTPQSSSLRLFALFPNPISPRQRGSKQGNSYKVQTGCS